MTHLSLRSTRRASALLVALSLGCSLPALAQRDGMQPHMGPGPFGGMGGRSPESAAQRVDRLLDGLNVGDAERSRIRQIVQSAAADIAGQREEGRSLHTQALQLFATPVVDAAAAEQLRQRMLAQHDRVSRRRLQAILEISTILTPEQRATAVQRMAAREATMRERMMRGRPPGPPR